jgi:hypothetical protein
MHLQEFAENSVDFAHFQPLHGSMMIPWTDKTLPLLKVPLQSHSWMRTYARWCCLCQDLRRPEFVLSLPLRLLQVQHNAAWFPGTEEEGKHIAHFVDKPVLTVFGKEIPKSGANADITFVGASTPLCPPPPAHPRQRALTILHCAPMCVVVSLGEMCVRVCVTACRLLLVYAVRSRGHRVFPIRRPGPWQRAAVPNPHAPDSHAAADPVPVLRRCKHPAASGVLHRGQLGVPVGQ